MPDKTEFDDLIGKTIASVELGVNDAEDWKDGDSNGRDCIKFTTAGGDVFAFSAYGDCCSRSWFNHLTGLDFLVGQRVVSIQEKLMSELEGAEDTYDDCVKVYGWTFVTTLGHVDLEMRNASNGYYGGSVDKIKGWDPPSDWKLVTGDF